MCLPVFCTGGGGTSASCGGLVVGLPEVRDQVSRVVSQQLLHGLVPPGSLARYIVTVLVESIQSQFFSPSMGGPVSSISIYFSSFARLSRAWSRGLSVWAVWFIQFLTVWAVGVSCFRRKLSLSAISAGGVPCSMCWRSTWALIP